MSIFLKMIDRISAILSHHIALIIIALMDVLFVCPLFASEPDSLAYRLEYQAYIYPQEKVYVATDKNVYVAGDTIRFRAFLVDALKLTQQKNGSKYVYVDVVDPFGKSVKQIKVKEKKGVFAGIVPLPEEMPEGTYTLGAYTLFMKNQGDDFIFRKPLPILSQMSKKYKLNTEFDGNELKTSLLEHYSDKPTRVFGVSLYSKDGVIRDNVNHRSDFSFSLNPKAMKEDVLMVKYDQYEKFVRVPKDTSSFIVTFHPEGGYMVPGVVNKIAFKALGNDGLSKEVKGEILNSKGEKVCDFESTHKGMGTFELKPSANVTYTAVINGKSFHLPVATSDASVFSVVAAGNDSVMVKVNGKFTPGQVLLADNCGIVTLAERLNNPEVKLSRKRLGSGLVQLYLLNSADDILSSRLIFNREGYIYNDSVTTIPLGDYAVTSRKLATDSLNTLSIVSEFMLQSDIKGHIEDPDYYFSDVDSIKDRNLDNLLLTQGWKRYDIQKAAKGEFVEPKEPMEIGGEITGTVYSRWKGKPLQGAIVNVLSPELDFGGVAETDSLGRFEINGTDWPDGTYFAVQAFNKNENQEHNLVVDNDATMNVEPLPEQYADINDYKNTNNVATWLQEVEVAAPLSDKELHKAMLHALGVRSISAEDIAKNNYTNYEEVIRTIPGLTVFDGNLVNSSTIGAYHGKARVEYWVDGWLWRPTHRMNTLKEFEENYPLSTVESIEYYKPSVAMFFSLNAAQNAGGLVVKTKNGSGASWDQNLFIKRVAPMGYQNIAEAYSPHFIYDPIAETPETLSYWYPQVSGSEDIKPIKDSDVLVEGITDFGLPYRGVIKAIDKD